MTLPLISASPATPREDVRLAPGELFFGAGQCRVGTLLGSCVAITLWHPARHIGGMCHYVIPERTGPRPEGEPLDGRYAVEAMAIFRRELAVSGTEPTEYEAKIFGAGNQFAIDPSAAGSRVLNVPERNIEVGLTLLQRHGFTVAAMHLGGTGSRHVTLHLGTGQVTLEFNRGRRRPRT